MIDVMILIRTGLPALAAAFALAGCAETLPAVSEDLPNQRALIGKTKQELSACAGNPVGVKTEGERTVMTYYKEASLLEESFPGPKSSLAMVHHGCRATLSLEQDRITEVRYESVPRSYRDEDHCEEIFERCTGP
ncbi:MAG TPA: hypothetical protein VKP13_19145 [Nitrospira sp.]|nr:hypothetical protein [Nitrospira sp.]